MNLYYNIDDFISDENLKIKWEKHKNIIESYDNYDFIRIY